MPLSSYHHADDDMNFKQFVYFAALCTWPLVGHAQYAWPEGAETGKLNLSKDIQYRVEAQVSVAKGTTPLWLNANRHGLSSLKSDNGYLRASVERALRNDSTRRWALGYGLDVVAPMRYTSKAVVQQAFVEARWLHGVLTVGSKEFPMELKNNRLSSGSQTLGINARPVPQARLALPEYCVLPFAHDWLRLKGHVAFGKMTDGNWQRDFVSKTERHTDNVLYHSKAGYLMIGNPDRFFPFSVELGLEMATTFGGTIYRPEADGTTTVLRGGRGLKDFWHAVVPGGTDVEETIYQNAAGNQLGSWLMRVNYDADRWGVSLYTDKFFEDHSGMFLLDYDGYGTGDEWNVRKKRRYFVYDLKDIMLGAEVRLKDCRWIDNVVVEYIYTQYQSGPVYHDHTKSFSEHIGGRDNYYNHNIYMGWQHWGQAIGNPLYTAPLYNKDGRIVFQNNRFTACHLGLSGYPTEQVDYRLLATYQSGLGTYDDPFTETRRNVSVMLEVTCHLNKGWRITSACGMDMGGLLGHNYGGRLTIVKTGFLK